MEHYLYHRVDPELKGTTLYPLNQLKNIYPDVYERHVKKYAGRGQWPLLYHLVPHVLYKGTIETKNLDILEL